VLAGSGDAPEIRPRVLPRPPFAYFYPGKAPEAGTRLRLVKVSEQRNRITDTKAWFDRNGLRLPLAVGRLENEEIGPAPVGVPATLDGERLIRAIESGPRLLLLYGPNYSDARILVAWDRKAGRPVYALDFANYLNPPRIAPREAEFVTEGVQWAAEADGLLYVSNFHRTYAKSSGNQNGYVTALDPKTGRLLWRSRPLVVNTLNFLVQGDAILTGYGFTAEPDFLYVLSRATGAVAQSVRIRSAAEYLIPKADRLYVRAYDTDYVFSPRR
jgi:hypothetical protein